MNILFIISTLQMGGAERVLSELANRWAATHTISVLTIDKGADFFILNKKISRYDLAIERKSRYNPLPHFKIIHGIKKITKQIDPDFVISFVGKTNVFTLLALKNTHRKIIVCEHSIINQPDVDKLIDFFRLRLYKKAYKIGVLSEHIKKEFVEKYTNCNANAVAVIPNALNIQDSSHKESVNFEKICNQKLDTMKIIVSLGRLDPVKGFDTLITIFNIVVKKMNNTRLIIFGEGSERNNLENLVDRLDLQKKVFLPGKIDNIQSVLKQADIFACTSIYEGLPMAILEAMSCIKPVISFNVPGVCDIVKNNKNGILVENNNLSEYANQIIHLLNNQQQVKSLTEEGLKTIKQFSPEIIDKIWLEDVLI